MSGFDKGAISVIEPGHAKYEDFDVDPDQGKVRHQSTPFYDQIISEYNKCEVGAIMVFDLPRTLKFYNLKNIFRSRGLIPNEDVVLARQEFDADGERLPSRHRPVKLKKLTDAVGKIVDTSSLEEQD